MALKPWYKIEGLTPREDLRDGKPLDASEFAVHLDKVRDKTAPTDYKEPERFLDRTYLTKYLTDFAAQVVRRLCGETTGTSAVFNLATQFGGGKTHALTLLYHLANNGEKSDRWTGVSKILNQAGISSIPKAAIAVFVGTEFDSLDGRGGDDGTPLRKTPWGEIAYQLGGDAALAVVAEHEKQFIEPKGDVIRKFLPKDKPCLILMDEIINYASTYRRKGYHNCLYNFIQALSETARGLDNVVLVVSIPASEMEYTSDDEADEQRFKKMLDRVGKPVIMSAEAETSEIIRRRLFEWDTGAVGHDGKILLPREAIATCNEYADWVVEHRQQLPQWFPIDNAIDAFQATYPFHPMLLSVFERKWQALPRFQRTRGVLRLLALWVSHAYQQGYKGAHRDPLIGLGTAPLEDPLFRTAVFEQMGENRLEGAVTTDICGKKDSHAIRLDKEAADAIKKSRLHRKVAATIFFESNGGCTRTDATVPEIRLAVAEPSLDIGNVETVLDALAADCYYLTIEKNRYRFSLSPNLNKLLADRRANIQSQRIDEQVRTAIQKVFTASQGIGLIPFPEKSSDIPNRPVLALAYLTPDRSMSDIHTLKLVESMIKEAGTSDRTFKSALIFAIASGAGANAPITDSDSSLREEARKVLAWEDIRDQEFTTLDESQQRQLTVNLKKAQSDLSEAVWRSYKNIVLLGKDNTLRHIDLGLVTSSSGSDKSIVSLIINRLRADGDVEDAISPRFLVRNWPPAFQEWSTKAVRDAFFASPQFPRLLKVDAVKDAIARGVKDGSLAYVGKAPHDQYEPFSFKTEFPASEVEISDDLYIIKAEEAEAYIQRITDPPKLTTLAISPQQVQLEPGKKQAFIVQGRDQYDQEIALGLVQWQVTGGTIDTDGVLQAGDDEGNFTVSATVGEVNGRAKFTVHVPKPPAPTDEDDSGEEDNQVKTPTGLKWKGEITPQKWMNFYTRVLSKLASDRQLKLTLKVEFSVEGEVSQQRTEETKVALQELGLDSDLENL
ncbi:MAG TPA: AAA family ATPase [Cyanobacteria bacterium UBA8803]|nr:AAA family ATPase [Cyanobacteria bacterium UBA9273]HBL62794.1 AAA family ATPase [Cyanobacteria bacterium UBA8803]